MSPSITGSGSGSGHTQQPSGKVSAVGVLAKMDENLKRATSALEHAVCIPVDPKSANIQEAVQLLGRSLHLATYSMRTLQIAWTV
jgi:hypothetical protein